MEWLANSSISLVELLITVLVLAMVLRPRRIQASPRVFLAIERRFRNLARRKTAAVVVVGLAALVGRAALIPILAVPEPYYHDEFSFLLAADTFAHGRLTNPTHPMWRHFETFHVNQQPTYMSMYPPAEGLVLAAGQMVGNPWIGNLVVTALMCSALCWMLQAWLPPAWAFFGGMLAVLRLGIFGYWINGYWCASVAGLAGALVLGALPRLRRWIRTRDAIWMALGLGILMNSRPYEGLVLSLPVLAAMLYWMVKMRPALVFRRMVAPITVVMAITAAATGYYNFRVTGNAFRMGYQVNRERYSRAKYFIWQNSTLSKPQYRYAVMERLYEGLEYKYYRDNRTLRGFVLHSADKIVRFWRFFLGPALTIPLLALGRTMRDRRMRFAVSALGFFLLGIAVEIFFQPHYFAPAVGLLYLVIMQCMRHLRFWKWRGQVVGPALVRAVPMICLTIVIVRVAAIKAGVLIEEPWPRGNVARANLLRNWEDSPGKQLAIVRYGPTHRGTNPEWVFNAADIDSAKVVWARDMGDKDNQELLRYFKDRQAWLVDPDEKPPKISPYLPANAGDNAVNGIANINATSP